MKKKKKKIDDSRGGVLRSCVFSLLGMCLGGDG